MTGAPFYDAAPLASYIPVAALAGVLVVVAYNMIEKEAFGTLLRSSRSDALVGSEQDLLSQTR